jgi:hypothetical protein
MFCDVTDANAPEADTLVDTSPRSTRDVGGAEVDEPHADTPTTTNTSQTATARERADLAPIQIGVTPMLPTLVSGWTNGRNENKVRCVY